jgi:hypothetical protein
MKKKRTKEVTKRQQWVLTMQNYGKKKITPLSAILGWLKRWQGFIGKDQKEQRMTAFCQKNPASVSRLRF